MLVHNPNNLASYIRDQCKRQKLTQATVGDLVGLKQATVSEFETRPASTKLDTLFRILSAAGLEMHLFRKEQEVIISGEK